MYLVHGSLASTVSPVPLDIYDSSIEESESESHIIEDLAHVCEVHGDLLGFEAGDLPSNDVVVEGV